MATEFGLNELLVTFLSAFNQTWSNSTGLDGNPTIKFHRNTSIGSVTDKYGQTEIEKEMTRLTGAFLDNAKALKIYFYEEIKRSDYDPIMLPTILYRVCCISLILYINTKMYKY